MAAVDAYRPEVARRACYRCEYCGYPEAASSTPLEVDHLVPEAKGGPTTLEITSRCAAARGSCTNTAKLRPLTP